MASIEDLGLLQPITIAPDGALLTYGLLASVLMLVACAAAWAIASSRGSWHAADKAQTGLVVSLAGAVFVGGALDCANWLIGIGNQVQ